MPDNSVHILAGQKARREDLFTKEQITQWYQNPGDNLEPIKNGTSGHRGHTGKGFSETHVAAITQALVDIRTEKGTFGPYLPDTLKNAPLGPIIMGKDVRFASDLAQVTAAEVFAANNMPVFIHQGGRSTPTPVVSHTILANIALGKKVEGVIITASHNPPEDAGYKSNGLDGGPNTCTKPIDEKGNYYLSHPQQIKRTSYQEAVQKGIIQEVDLLTPYIKDLSSVVDVEVIKSERFAVTPLGGSSHGYYEAVNAEYGTRIEVVLSAEDPTCSNRSYDWDGKLRGDPSSRYVMKAVQGIREKLGVPFIGANDNDADRFGGEDSTGILNPNHVLCVLFDYLAANRGFNSSMGVGRTIGTTHMIEEIAKHYGRPSYEVNVGFKHYVAGLMAGKYVLAGEESAGLSFPKRDGSLWVTEKDGIAAVLLMMEAMAKTGKDIGTLYADLVKKYGPYQYERKDVPAKPDQKSLLTQLAGDPSRVKSLLNGKKIAGQTIERLAIGDGIKVVLSGGVWVLKRTSGTENIIKDYREEKGESLERARKASQEIGSLLGLN
ncbi:MAG TPA: alpha-D-glucose phosphate-specific phosphoglucomutase [Firmicutes bacterium]|jgi:phosphoglucomutase|nr:alpha-D-glucose phosphate-specific phosphoglucomutase [Bacillota bacterium]